MNVMRRVYTISMKNAMEGSKNLDFEKMRKVQLFGNPEESRAAVKECLITWAVYQLSGIFGWFEFSSWNYQEKFNGWTCQRK